MNLKKASIGYSHKYFREFIAPEGEKPIEGMIAGTLETLGVCARQSSVKEAERQRINQRAVVALGGNNQKPRSLEY